LTLVDRTTLTSNTDLREMNVAKDPFGDASSDDDSTGAQRFFKKVKKWSSFESDLPVFKLSDLSDEEKAQIEHNMGKPIEDIDFELLRLIQFTRDMPSSAYVVLVSVYEHNGLGRGSYMDPDIKYLAQHRIIPENYMRSSFELQTFRIRPTIMQFLKANEALWHTRDAKTGYKL